MQYGILTEGTWSKTEDSILNGLNYEIDDINKSLILPKTSNDFTCITIILDRYEIEYCLIKQTIRN